MSGICSKHKNHEPDCFLCNMRGLDDVEREAMTEATEDSKEREPSPDDKPHEHWRVEVSTFGEQIVAIETEMVAGREISDKDQATIELCARHLLGFIGK